MTNSSTKTTDSVWKKSHRSAIGQTLELVRLDSVPKATLTIGTPILAVGGIWLATGQLIVSALAVLSAAMAVGVLVYLFKLIAGPAEIAEAALASIDSNKSETEAIESARRRDMINRLTKLYLLEMGESAPAAVRAELQLPPVDWLNENLAEHGERWQVFETNGMSFQTFELKVIHWVYHGVRLHSERAVRWAAFFDELGIEWEGKEGSSRNGSDIWLPELDCEVLAVRQHSAASLELAKKIAEETDRQVIIAPGVPIHGNQGMVLVNRTARPIYELRWMEDRRDRGVYWLADENLNIALCLGGPGESTDHDRMPITSSRIASAIDFAAAVKPDFSSEAL